MIWDGVPLGFNRDGRPIAYNAGADGSGNAPTLVFGPMGSRKSVGLVATQLLDEPGQRSFVVIDPKGEIAAITANYRRRVCGKDNVKIINPYGLLVADRPDLASDKWNPLVDLEPNALSFGDDCQAKGNSLIKTASAESQPHFPDAARSGITGTMMWEVKEADRIGRPRSLPNVRALLTLDEKAIRATVEKMAESKDFDISTRARKFLDGNNEIQSIKSTVETQTAWMTQPMRDDMTTRGGVDFRDCAKRPTTIYIIIPTKELEAKAVYLRLALSSALRALYHHDGVPTTLIVEEGFVLGHHAEIEQALSALRGYGSRMTIVFQSLQQIKELYPKTWGLFTAGAVLAFRPADTETAKWLVEKADKVIVPVLSAADPSSPNDFGVRPSWQQQQRDRIPLRKMFGMPQGRALVWVPHDEAPRISYVKGYFEIPELNARADANPYYKGKKSASPGRTGKGGVKFIAALAIAGGLHEALKLLPGCAAEGKTGAAAELVSPAPPLHHHHPKAHHAPAPAKTGGGDLVATAH